MMRSALQKSGAFASKTMMSKASPSSSIGSVRGMAKDIKFGVDGRSAMLKGVETLADAVQVCTLTKEDISYRYMCFALNRNASY